VSIEGRTSRKARRLSGRSGFTLVELMVVMAIMAVLAGIVVPTVMGVGRMSRGTAMKEDVNSLQTAFDRFQTDTGKAPTFGQTPAPTGTPSWAAGSLPSDPYLAGIDFSYSAMNRDGTQVALYPDMVKRLPKHSTENNTSDSIRKWRVDKNGVVSVALDSGQDY